MVVLKKVVKAFSDFYNKAFLSGFQVFTWTSLNHSASLKKEKNVS